MIIKNYFSLLISIVLISLEINANNVDNDVINVTLNCRDYAGGLLCKSEMNNINLSENKSLNYVVDQKTKKRNNERIQISRESKMEKIPQKLGIFFMNLKTLIAMQVGLREIKNEDFINLTQLESLNLGDNQLMKIEYNAFHRLTELKNLYLYGNKIQTIHIATFLELTSLKIISLAENELELLNDVFPRNFELEEIYLNGNKLKRIDIEFSSKKNLTLVDVRNNSKYCLCDKPNILNNTDFSTCDINRAHRQEKIHKNFHSCIQNQMKKGNETAKLIEHCTLNLTQSLDGVVKEFSKCAVFDKKFLSNASYVPFIDSCIINRITLETKFFLKFDACINDEIKRNLEVEKLLKNCVDTRTLERNHNDEIYARCTFCEPLNRLPFEIEKCHLRYSRTSGQTIESFQEKILQHF